jgi:hypothetical protein
MGEGLARRDIAVEGQEQRPRNIALARIGDAHGRDRLGCGGHLGPDAKRLKHPAYTGGNGRGARIARHR